MLNALTDESGRHMQHRHRADHSEDAAPSAEFAHALPPSLEWAQLTRLATHLAQVSAALLVQDLPGGPVVLDASGLPASQQAAAVALCAKVITDGWQGYRGLEALGYVHTPRNQAAARAAGEDPEVPGRKPGGPNGRAGSLRSNARAKQERRPR